MILTMRFGDWQLTAKKNVLFIIDATLSEMIAIFQGDVTKL
jgi:hypothetical protein